MRFHWFMKKALQILGVPFNLHDFLFLDIFYFALFFIRIRHYYTYFVYFYPFVSSHFNIFLNFHFLLKNTMHTTTKEYSHQAAKVEL